MSVELTLIIVMAVFVVLMACEMPIALSVLVSGGVGIVLARDLDIFTNVAVGSTYSSTAKYALVVIPMYVLMGCLIANAGVATQLYRVVNRVLGGLPGGLPATAVGATAMFSGISGSSAADVAVFGRLSVTEMVRHGYSKPYSCAVVAAAGAFAVLIPPSIILVLYAVLANQSVGAMLLAGVIPGILSAVVLVAYVVVTAWIARRRSAASVGGGAAPAQRDPSGEFRRRDLVSLVYAGLLFAVVVGGLYGGYFTATEAGAVGAFVALLIMVFARSGRTVSLGRALKDSLRESVDVTSMIFLLLIGGAVFAYFIATSGVSRAISDFVTGLEMSHNVVLAIFLLMLIPLGLFLDSLTVLLLVTPLMLPALLDMGFDGVWLGILIIKMVEIGLITPPVGLNVFIISGIVSEPAERIFRAVLPFVILDLCFTALLFAFPDIVLWLPRSAGLV